MKCPQCGQWNRDSMPHCTRCGAKLNIDAVKEAAWAKNIHKENQSKAYIRVDEFGEEQSVRDERDALAVEMKELKRRKEQGAEIQERLRQQRVERGGFSVSIEDANGNPLPIWEEEKDASGRSVQMRRMSQEGIEEGHEAHIRSQIRELGDSGMFLDSRSYEPVGRNTTREIPGYSSSFSTRYPDLFPNRRKKHRGKAFLKVLLIILGAILLIACGFFAWNYFSSRNSSMQTNRTAVVTASMLDEAAAHTIMIPGEDGQQIYIKELHASYMVSNGFATIEVADHTWYDNYQGSLDETMQVTLTPFLKTASGKQTPLDPITYTINIPLSPVSLDSPDSRWVEVSTTMSAIRITVRPGSTVLVNGQDCSDTVNSQTGEMIYNATVQPIGDNEFTFVVRSPYCRENIMTVVLYREPQEIPLDLAAGTYGTTNSSKMRVSATTMPGAYIEVLSPHSDLDITNLNTTGKFSFYALFDTIGNNEIVINASSPGKKTSVIRHTVYYLPPASEYTVKAWPLNQDGYAELLSNIAVRTEHKQVYVVIGTVQYSVSDKPQMVVINTSDDEKSQPVLLENYTNTKWEVGKKYRIYGDVNSTYNGMPWLNARYTYDDEKAKASEKKKKGDS